MQQSKKVSGDVDFYGEEFLIPRPVLQTINGTGRKLLLIDEIDKSITHLQKIKDALTSSDRQLRLANDKAQDLTIRKLTKNAPSVKQKLDEVRKQNAE